MILKTKFFTLCIRDEGPQFLFCNITFSLVDLLLWFMSKIPL